MAPTLVETLPDIGVTIISGWIFNTYVVHDGGDGAPLIVDVGIGSNARAVIDLVLADLDVGLDNVGPVVATHAHSDHVAGIGVLADRTGCSLHLPAKVKDYADGETPRTPGPRSVMRALPAFLDQPFNASCLRELAGDAPSAGYGQQTYRMPVEVAGYLADGDTVPGAPDWAVLHTPGHTDDSTSFYNSATRTLLSGDAVLGIGRRAWVNPEFVHEGASAATEERLRELDVEVLLPGHGRACGGSDVMGDALSYRERPPGRTGDSTGPLRRFLSRHAAS